MKKRLAILGATGSIGLNALDVVRALADRFEIVALSAHSRWRDAIAAAATAGASLVIIGRESDLPAARRVAPAGLTVQAGADALDAVCRRTDIDIVLNAIVGIAGLRPTLAAVETGKRVALANKESLVAAGALIASTAKRTGAEILPVDSEHSALFQCLKTGRRDELDRLILTASGGPFFGATAERLASATPSDALKHPTWSMGRKITIDSATLINKALELIEAAWLFDVPETQIDVVVHPQSVVHSLVRWRDGSVIAQLGAPDMRTPIQFALTYPDRLKAAFQFPPITDLSGLTFFPPDETVFPALKLARRALTDGGISPAAFNAANEAAVDLFLNGRIALPMIYDLIRDALDTVRQTDADKLENILAADRLAREHVASRVESMKR
ncbi:MAG: 1-deoxy-D-xylulose-5-phosphate reductoisomerase [Planctomycetota bacterium]